MIKNALLELARKYSFFGKFKHDYQKLRDSYYYRQKIDSNLVVFESYRSTKYADSPRAIYEYLLEHEEYKDYRFIWVFEHPERYDFLRSDRTTLVKHESNAYYVAFARAKYWVVNGWIPLRLNKKAGQIALQCWHGTPLKRLRYDILTNSHTEHQKNALRENDEDMKRYDYFISPSKFTTKVFTSAFNLKALGKENILVETGYPRNDFLHNFTIENQVTLRRTLKLPEDKKVLLYAPTWRDDQYANEGGYNYSSPVDFDLLKKKLGKDWVILFRAHNLVSNAFDFKKYRGFVKDVSSYDDISELYVVSDALMTDYSSVFFDYANLKRPIIFFMYDLEHYKHNLRGFYLNLDQLPGDITTTETDVVDILNNIDGYVQKHHTEYERFNTKYNYLDDGRATSRVVTKVFNG